MSSPRTATATTSSAVDWLGTPRLQESSPPLDKNGPTPVTEAAMASPSVAGLRTWLRYPSYDVTQTPEGYRVDCA